MAEQTVNMPNKLHSTLCDEADRADLQPGEVRPRDDMYPVFEFSGGHTFYEKQNGTGPVKQRL